MSGAWDPREQTSGMAGKPAKPSAQRTTASDSHRSSQAAPTVTAAEVGGCLTRGVLRGLIATGIPLGVLVGAAIGTSVHSTGLGVFLVILDIVGGLILYGVVGRIGRS